VRRLYQDSASSPASRRQADAFTLFERFERSSTSTRASHALGGGARQGLAHRPHPAAARSDAGGRRSRAFADHHRAGDVLEPEQGVVAIGSGGPYAQSAALALLQNTELGRRATSVDKGLAYRRRPCIYTNHQRTIEVLE